MSKVHGKRRQKPTQSVMRDGSVVDVAALRAEASRAGTRFWVLLVVVSLLSSMVMPYLSMASIVASDSKVFDGEVIPGYSMGGIDIASYGVDINKWGQSDATEDSPKMVRSTYGYWNTKRAEDAESNLKASIDADKEKAESENAVTPLADYEIQDEMMNDEDKAKAWIGITRDDGEGHGLSDFRNNPSGVEPNSDRYNYSESVAPYRTQEDWKFWDSQTVGGQNTSMTTTIYPDFVIFGWDEKNQCARVLTNPDSLQNESTASGASSSAVVAGTAAVPHYVPLSTLFEAYGISDTVMNENPELGMNDMDTLLDAINRDAAENNGKSPILNKIVRNENHEIKNDLMLGTHYENLNQGKAKNGETRDEATDAWNPYPYSMVFSMKTSGGTVVSSIYNNTEAYTYFSPRSAYLNYMALRQEYDALVGAGASQIADEQPQSAFQLGYYLAGMAILEAYLNEALPQDMTRGYVGPAEGNPRVTQEEVLSDAAKLSTRPSSSEGTPSLFPTMLGGIDYAVSEEEADAPEGGTAITGFKTVEGSQLMYDFADAAIASFGATGVSTKLGATSAIMNSLSTYGYGVMDAGLLTNTSEVSAGQGPNRGMSRRQTMSRITHFGPYEDSAADMSAAIGDDDEDPLLHPEVENDANTGFYIAPYYPIQQHEMPITGEMEYRFQILSMIPYQALTYELGVHGFDDTVTLSYESVKLRDLDRTINYTNKAAALAAQLDDIEKAGESLSGYDTSQSIVINPQSPSARYETVTEQRSRDADKHRDLTSRIDNALMSYDNGQMNADNVHDFVDIARAIRGVKYETFTRYYNPLKSSGGTDDVFLSRVSPADTAYMPSFLFQGYECAGGTTNNQQIQSTAAASYDYFSVPSLAACLAERTAGNVYYGSMNREMGVFFSKAFLSTLPVALNTPNLEEYESILQRAEDSDLDPAECVYDLKTKIVELYVLTKRLAFAEAYSKFMAAAGSGGDLAIPLGDLVRAGLIDTVKSQGSGIEAALTPTDSDSSVLPDKYSGNNGATALRNKDRKLPDASEGGEAGTVTGGNSPLVDITMLSPNHSGERNHAIDTITPHYMAGDCTVEVCGQIFQPTSRQASSNYGIGSDGRIGLYCEEKNRAWTSGSAENDNRAVTIECANLADGSLTDKCWKSLVNLCADICKRNGKTRCVYKGSADYSGLAPGDMLLTMHKWFQSTDCPGPWLSNQFDRLAKEVNAKLKSSSGSSSSSSVNAPAGGSEAAATYETEGLATKGYKTDDANWLTVRHASSDGIAVHVPSSFKKANAKDFAYVMQKSGPKHVLGGQLDRQVIWCKDSAGNAFVTTAKVAFSALYLNMFDRHLSEKASDSYFWDYPSNIAELSKELDMTGAYEASSSQAQEKKAAKSSSAKTSGARQKVVDLARQQVGKAYGLWSTQEIDAFAGTPDHFDCNTLTYWCWKQVGVSIPHPSGHYGEGQFQWLKNSGRWVTSESQLKPGDLVFFSRDGGNSIYHVALYSGNGKIVHAIDAARGVDETELSFCSGFCGGGPVADNLGNATASAGPFSPPVPEVSRLAGETTEYDTVAMDYSKLTDVEAAKTALADYTIAAFWGVTAVDDRDRQELPKQMQNVLGWADAQSAAESEDNYNRQIREADAKSTHIYEIVPTKGVEDEEEEDEESSDSSSSESGTGLGTGDPNAGEIKVPADVIGEAFTWTGYGKEGIWYADGSTRPWAAGTDQRAIWDLWVSKGKTYDHGIATIDGLYLAACKPREGDTGFGVSGDVITFYTEEGKAINCLIADEKGSDAASPWGHPLDNGHINIVEFEVNVDETGGAGSANVWYPELGSGNIRSATNHGRHPDLGGNASITSTPTSSEKSDKKDNKDNKNNKNEKRRVSVHCIQDLIDAGYEVVDNDGDWGAAPVYADNQLLYDLQARMVRGVAGETYLATHRLAAYTISAVVARDDKLTTTSSAAGGIPYSGLSASRLMPGTSRYATLEAHTVDRVGITSGLSGDLRTRATQGSLAEVTSSSVDASTAQQLDRKSQQVAEVEASVVPSVMSMATTIMDNVTPEAETTSKSVMDDTNSSKANAAPVTLGSLGHALSAASVTRADAAASSFVAVEMNRPGASRSHSAWSDDGSSATASAAESAPISYDAYYAKWLVGDGQGIGFDLSGAYALLQSVALLLVLISLMIIAFQNFVGYMSGNERDYVIAQTQFKTVFPRALIAIAMIGLPPLAGGTGFQGGGFLLLQIIHSIMDILFGSFMPANPMSLIGDDIQALIANVGTGSFQGMFVTLLCSLVVGVIGVVITLLALLINILLFAFWLISPIAWAAYVWPYGTGAMPKGGSFMSKMTAHLTKKMKHKTFTDNAMGNAVPSGFVLSYFKALFVIIKWNLTLWLGSIMFQVILSDDMAAEIQSFTSGGVATGQAASVVGDALIGIVDSEIVAPLKAVTATALLAFLTYAMYLGIKKSLGGRMSKAYGMVGKLVHTAAMKGTGFLSEKTGKLADQLGKYDGSAGGRSVASTALGIGARYIGGISRGMEMLGAYATSDAGKALGGRIRHHATNLGADVDKRTKAQSLVTRDANGRLQLDASVLGLGQALSEGVRAEVNAHRDRRDIREARGTAEDIKSLEGTTAQEYTELREQGARLDSQIETLGQQAETMDAQGEMLLEQSDQLDEQMLRDEDQRDEQETIERWQDAVPKLMESETSRIDRDIKSRKKEVAQQQLAVAQAQNKLEVSSDQDKEAAQKELDAAMESLSNARGILASAEARREAALKTSRIAGYDAQDRKMAERLTFDHVENGQTVGNVTARGADPSRILAAQAADAADASRQTVKESQPTAAATHTATNMAQTALRAGQATRGNVAGMERARDASHDRRRERLGQLGQAGGRERMSSDYDEHRQAMAQSQTELTNAKNKHLTAQSVAPGVIERGNQQAERNDSRIVGNMQGVIAPGTERILANGDDIAQNQSIMDWREGMQREIRGASSSLVDGSYRAFARGRADAPRPKPKLPGSTGPNANLPDGTPSDNGGLPEPSQDNNR